MPTVIHASFAGGMNAAAHSPRLMAENQARLLVNATVRGGFAEPRPAFLHTPVIFHDRYAQLFWSTLPCQGAEFYDSPEGPAIVAVFGGHVVFLSLADMRARRLTTNPYSRAALLHARVPFAHLCQRGPFMVIQDGTTPPVILNGRNIFRQGGDVSTRVPAGTLMADGWNRLAVASHDRRRIYFSDHDMGGNGFLSFTEDTAYFLNARYFQVPPNLGRLVALKFAPSLNGTKRFGPLLAFCERGTMAYDVSIPRSAWLTQDITAMILPHLGACAHRAVTTHGAATYFSDHAGRIQALSGAVADMTDATLRPVDEGVWPLYRHERHHAHRMSVTFDDRTLTTVFPERVKRADGMLQVRHHGFIVQQHSPLAQPPVWDGLWTGVHPVAITRAVVAGRERCFILSLDDDGHRLYELDTLPGDDRLKDSMRPVTMTVSTRTADFDAPFRAKTVAAAVLRLGAMRGPVSVGGWWIKDRTAPAPWFQHDDEAARCMPVGCDLRDLVPESRPRISLPDPGGEFYEAGMAFSITGQARLEEVALEASDAKNTSRVPDTHCVSATIPACPPAFLQL